MILMILTLNNLIMNQIVSLLLLVPFSLLIILVRMFSEFQVQGADDEEFE